MIKYIDDSTHDIKNMQKNNNTDGGYDICSNQDITIYGGESVAVETLVKVAMPIGFTGIMSPRSGLNFNKNIVTEIGIIDTGYRGYMKVKLTNLNSFKYEVKKGDKIAQLVVVAICPEGCIKVDSLDDTDRGDNGFGSSGI